MTDRRARSLVRALAGNRQAWPGPTGAAVCLGEIYGVEASRDLISRVGLSREITMAVLPP